MEEGSCAATSTSRVRQPGERLGTRCEIKNVNSIRFVQQAIEYEARRQIEVIEEGGTIRQETRLFDSGKRRSRGPCAARKMRTTTATSPIPTCCRSSSIPPGSSASRPTLPELPDAKKARFMPGLRPLAPMTPACSSPSRRTAHFYETVAKGRDAKLAANWLITELFGLLNKAGKSTSLNSPVSAEALGGLVDLIADNTISGRIAKDVFAEMVETGKDAAAIVEEKGLRQVTDTGAIEEAIDRVLAANADKLANTARARRSSSASSSARS